MGCACLVLFAGNIVHSYVSSHALVLLLLLLLICVLQGEDGSDEAADNAEEGVTGGEGKDKGKAPAAAIWHEGVETAIRLLRLPWHTMDRHAWSAAGR